MNVHSLTGLCVAPVILVLQPDALISASTGVALFSFSGDRLLP